MEDDENKIVPLFEDEQRNIAMESMQLAEDRLYIVLHAKDDDNVSLRMYDTTDSEDVTGAHVLLHGLMYLLDNKYDEVVNYGHEAIVESLAYFEEEEEDFNVKNKSDNVVSVKFSKDN
tara:strand:+ start:8633 stop:8986 length:354 start_codon:yes stop_codon:yes gene_type:complete